MLDYTKMVFYSALKYYNIRFEVYEPALLTFETGASQLKDRLSMDLT